MGRYEPETQKWIELIDYTNTIAFTVIDTSESTTTPQITSLSPTMGITTPPSITETISEVAWQEDCSGKQTPSLLCQDAAVHCVGGLKEFCPVTCGTCE